MDPQVQEERVIGALKSAKFVLLNRHNATADPEEWEAVAKLTLLAVDNVLRTFARPDAEKTSDAQGMPATDEKADGQDTAADHPRSKRVTVTVNVIAVPLAQLEDRARALYYAHASSIAHWDLISDKDYWRRLVHLLDVKGLSQEHAAALACGLNPDQLRWL